jgi:hypothetical protein
MAVWLIILIKNVNKLIMQKNMENSFAQAHVCDIKPPVMKRTCR